MIVKSIRFTPELWDYIKKEAKSKNISVSAYIRMKLSE